MAQELYLILVGKCACLSVSLVTCISMNAHIHMSQRYDMTHRRVPPKGCNLLPHNFSSRSGDHIFVTCSAVPYSDYCISSQELKAAPVEYFGRIQEYCLETPPAADTEHALHPDPRNLNRKVHPHPKYTVPQVNRPGLRPPTEKFQRQHVEPGREQVIQCELDAHPTMCSATELNSCI